MTTPSADWVEPPEWFDPSAALEAKNPIPLLKHAIAEERSWIEQRLHARASIESLIREHLRFTDALIQTCWQRFKWDENLNSWRKTRISLVAVGGYGRGELMPHSDIDLLLLSERDNLQKHAANIQSFTTLLWDIGLEIGHSVRGVKEAFRQAKGDVTIMTSMLDARLLSGSPILLDQLNQMLDRRKSWRITEFFDAKVHEQDERHAKSNHTEYSLEPNIKTSPGGLRDIQTLLWIARLMYKTDDLETLVTRGFFEQQEADQLVEAQRFFWRVRFALHLARGKDENRLLFDHQRLLASLLGYEDKAQLAVEQFMQDYYRCALAVSSINEVSLQAFDEKVLSTHRKKRTTVGDINERFQIIDEKLAVKASNLFEQHPEALLEMFVILGESPTLKGIRSNTIRLAKTHVHLINDSFRQSETATGLFIRLLGVEHHLFSQLRRMNRLGILGAYLPEFERVVGQMQFDLFHIYTVDAHTLQVVRNMRRFRYKDQRQQFPIAAHIHERLPRVELLYVAGFFHDLAKGMGGDHSSMGIGIAKSFCERHRLGLWETNLICWLVEHHLLMSTTAQRKDIFDPDVVRTFAEQVGDQVRLDYFYALTVADINATNPTLWNSWKASLMRQLYLETKRMLRLGVDEMIDRDEYLLTIRNNVIEKLAERDISEDRASVLWEGLGEDYFLRESAPNMVWHAESMNNHDSSHGPLILIGEDASRLNRDEGSNHIFIHAKPGQASFLQIVTALEQLDLNVVDARIPSNAAGRRDYIFDVLETSPLTSDQDARNKAIHKALSLSLDGKGPPSASRRRTPRALKQFDIQSQISIQHRSNRSATDLEIVTADRPGLLVRLARLFESEGVEIIAAKITTLGERVEDVFEICSTEGHPISDPDQLERLKLMIRDQLDAHIAETST